MPTKQKTERHLQSVGNEGQVACRYSAYAPKTIPNLEGEERYKERCWLRQEGALLESCVHGKLMPAIKCRLGSCEQGYIVSATRGRTMRTTTVFMDRLPNFGGGKASTRLCSVFQSFRSPLTSVQPPLWVRPMVLRTQRKPSRMHARMHACMPKLMRDDRLGKTMAVWSGAVPVWFGRQR